MSLEEKENRPDLRQAYSSPFNPKALIFCEPVGRSPGFPFADAFPFMIKKQWLAISASRDVTHMIGLQLRGQLPFLTGFPFNHLKV